MPLDVLLASAGEAVVTALEAAAALVIVVAGARALLAFFASLLRRGFAAEDERLLFARGLLLGLDFTIGSDILKIALRPTLDAVLVVGLVVLVRTILTFVLEYELRREDARQLERRARVAIGAGSATPREG